jgi:hypothetical protein
MIQIVNTGINQCQDFFAANEYSRKEKITDIIIEPVFCIITGIL